MMSTTSIVFFLSACGAAIVSLYGVCDAWLTVRALDDSERWSGNSNARLLAKGGVRTASLRSLQMLGLVHVSLIAMTITPRPSLAEAVSVVWIVLAVVSWLSTIKEVLAIRDRRAIKPEATPC
jgi:hypothetical protein